MSCCEREPPPVCGCASMKGSLQSWHAATSRSGTHGGGEAMWLSSSTARDLPSTPLGCIESRGVKPSRFGSPTDAPRPTSEIAISTHPPNAAVCMAVFPLSASCASSGSGTPASPSISSSRAVGKGGGDSAPPPAPTPAPPPSAAPNAPTPAASWREYTARSASRCSAVWPASLRAAGSAPCSRRRGMPLATCGACRMQVWSGVFRA
mmetsp:Transcript_10373/g.34403  ORF Transcript_10373/g.34403 Transcript_10373/m.34403 type:complete len:207 (-) Transcript_10373:295-915(-)